MRAPSVQFFAFNTEIAKELKSRIARAILPKDHPDYKSLSIAFPSPYQAKVIEWVSNGAGCAVVKARAGSGKTTTALGAMDAIPDVDLTQVRAGTFHSVGYGAILKRLNLPSSRVKADDGKVRKILRETLGDLDYEVYGSFCFRLVGLAKGEGIGALVPDTDDRWYEIIQHHDLFLDAENAEEARAIDIARAALRSSNLRAQSGDIDFNDMLYLPILWKLRLWQNDWVIVDEAQDTNPVRRAIAKLALRPGGRLMAVGDNCQAIYGFTGASHDALDLIKRDFAAIELPLTVTYRCPKAVVALAQTIVPDLEAWDGAKDGIVHDVDFDHIVKTFTPSDAVLCRNVAPLIETAFALIARGIGCHVLGREIGQGLIEIVKKRRAVGIPSLEKKLEEYRDREVAKWTAKGEELKAEQANDRVACIMTVIEHLTDRERTVPGLITKLETMFSDTNGVLTLSTCHKAKGREWNRVAIVRPDLMPSKWARQEWQQIQEQNLMYVAYTRAMQELAFVALTGKPKREDVQ